MVTLKANNKSKVRKNQSYWGEVIYRLRKNRMAMISLYLLIVIIGLCVLVPILSPYKIETTDMQNRDQSPSAKHWLGTDKIGRDMFVRLFYGGRISLLLAIAVVALECFIGVILGSISGFYGGIADVVIMRVAEVFMSFPYVMFCITVVAVFGNSVAILIFVLAIISWPSIARIVRGQILTLREMEYMEACESLGISDMRRIFKHLLPNVLAYVIVYATLGMATVILAETTLSFLGLGVSPPIPTWGNMIQEARNTLIIQQKWWYWIPPGICIFLSVMCFNLLGDGMRDAIDPKMKR